MIKSFVKKTRKGKVLRVVREHYLRNDIGCGLDLCATCSHADAPSSLGVASRYILPDTNIVLHHPDLLEHSAISNVIILQVVLDETRNRSPHTYTRLRGLIANASKHFFVFLNEHHKDTYVTQIAGETPNDRNDRAIRTATSWYKAHALQSQVSAEITLLTDDAACLSKARDENITCMTAKDYVAQYLAEEHPDLLDIVSRPTALSTALDFKGYLSSAEISTGLRTGTLMQGVFHASRDRRKGVVMCGSEEIVIEGFNSINRAIHDDVVIVRRIETKQPAEEVARDVNMVVPEPVMDDSDVVTATGEITGIVKRMWRPYVGTIEHSTSSSRDVLMMPIDRRIPKIRVRTKQAEMLKGMRIVVQLDDWPVESRYPNGHYVRCLGPSGDKSVETAALLIEHEIPTNEFSDAVNACLPIQPWKADVEWLVEQRETVDEGVSSVVVELVDKRGDTMTVNTATKDTPIRRDLRHLDVCSVDPIGCTDIDDALHVTKLNSGLYEVGVHIADVSYFVRPGTALDAEASRRATTVYLVDQRIEMLPSLLSTHICSLQEGVDRFAFSVIWTMDDDGNIKKPTWFGRSIIRSRRAFSYEQAQAQMDDVKMTDKTTNDLRILNAIAKKLRVRRRAAGTLVLASPEVRFKLEDGGDSPVDCDTYELREANSMVEEYMLLANVTVAERIQKAFSHCALLRRHPEPRDGPLQNLSSAAKQVLGVDIDIASSLALGQSLDAAAEQLKKPHIDKLLRIMTTRCMSRARYFSSGAVPNTEYLHYGLAVPIYTHFTSPIRRYADLVVHRLLAAALGQKLHANAIATKANDDSAGAASERHDLYSPTRTDMQVLTDTINRRAYAAQLSGRASVELHSLLYFQDRTTTAMAHVTRIRDDGVSVLVQQYGVEAIIHTRDIPIDADHDHVAWRNDDVCLTGTLNDAIVCQVSLFDELNVIISSEIETDKRARIVVRVAKGMKRKQ